MTRNINSFVVYMVLGALALGVLPAVAEGSPSESDAAQQNRAGGDAPAVTRTARTSPPKVNTAPLRAFLVRAKRLKDQGKIDLGAPRSVTVEADRAADGTLSNAVISGPSSADPAFRKLALDFVSSLNESRALAFLGEDVSRVRMDFALDAERFRVESASETPSEARAGEMARGYRAMINIARIVKRGGDEAVVLNNMKVSASGKQLVMNLDMPRETMGNILLKQITPN